MTPLTNPLQYSNQPSRYWTLAQSSDFLKKRYWKGH